ncbi:glycosyltransferase family 59 protein [Sphaerobolus stellatus SS14]|uniref:Dol-P-Glc:Glc(2)Man(9)GlcNAc(2)-PP-Dol alpha-1,2-glucosyltransferase n=1 Tax=Sphaerobolus stellatus (strain SS14) TaxID=990650 RepID=A0A0C9W3C7_SPHS4|nr:glycosyltransferase family 59 protein [Sphaerobolus stellatus SS14]
MDEPFHVPQAQAYCRGEWETWDPKITTPPGLYILSIILSRIFMLKCNLPMLRLTPLLTLLCLPIILHRIRAFHHRISPARSFLAASFEDMVIASFPVAWFFGFLYYTDVPSLVSVLATIAAATQGQHTLAGLLGLVSCVFRQTNIIWTLYAFAISQLMVLRFEKKPKSQKLHDPPALEASPGDLLEILKTLPRAIPSLILPSIPYLLCCIAFAAFVVWNGGIVLGDKSNHIPVIHIPQVYYFVGFATLFGWPVLISYQGGPAALLRDVRQRMIGTPKRVIITTILLAGMVLSIHKFTIHHPFLLSDNRHYTFYVWRRVFRLHPVIPYLLAPVYLACAWVWFLRIGKEQTLLQTLTLPLAILPSLLPTPLLEPRYFLIPYILLRAQAVDVPTWSVALEGLWYAAINAATMYVFVYAERPGVGRFMW